MKLDTRIIFFFGFRYSLTRFWFSVVAIMPCAVDHKALFLHPLQAQQPSHLRVRFFSILYQFHRAIMVGFYETWTNSKYLLYIIASCHSRRTKSHHLLNKFEILAFNIAAIMPFSNAKRRRIFSTLSSIVENSFLDETADDAVVGVVPPSPKLTRQIKRRTANKVTKRDLQSIIVVYTMIFFNGCE